MSKTLSKVELVRRLRAAHADLQATIDGLSGEQMTRLGIIGDGSVKDLIAHLTYWERRAAFLLESAIDGYRKEADIWKVGSVDDQNERNFEHNQARPAADVLADWRSILETLVSLIERLPEEYLTGQTRPDWLGGGTLSIRIADETFGHIEEHWPDLQDGLARLPR